MITREGLRCAVCNLELPLHLIPREYEPDPYYTNTTAPTQHTQHGNERVSEIDSERNDLAGVWACCRYRRSARGGRHWRWPQIVVGQVQK